MFLLANHGQPWRWVRWRYFGGDICGGVLEKLGEAYGGRKRKLVVEEKGKKEKGKRKKEKKLKREDISLG